MDLALSSIGHPLLSFPSTISSPLFFFSFSSSSSFHPTHTLLKAGLDAVSSAALSLPLGLGSRSSPGWSSQSLLFLASPSCHPRSPILRLLRTTE